MLTCMPSVGFPAAQLSAHFRSLYQISSNTIPGKSRQEAEKAEFRALEETVKALEIDNYHLRQNMEAIAEKGASVGGDREAQDDAHETKFRDFEARLEFATNQGRARESDLERMEMQLSKVVLSFDFLQFLLLILFPSVESCTHSFDALDS